MIIFYEKDSGVVLGTIGGRIASDPEKTMWLGEEGKVERIIIDWIPTAWYNKDGQVVDENDPSIFTADFIPDHPQKELFKNIDKGVENIYDYKVDLKTGEFVKK